MSIEVNSCNFICVQKSRPFCGHEYGRGHPECQRCNVLTPVPEPQCFDFELKRSVKIDRCCTDLFNDTSVEELKVTEGDYFDFDFREEILQNFTINDCYLSALHLPQYASPRTLFYPYTCCKVGYCSESAGGGQPLTFLTAVTGIGSLRPKSLARNSPSCPPAHCIRPSLARPGKLICCVLIRAPWRNGRIAICPNSCD